MNGPYGHLPLYPGPEEETAVMMVINFRRPSVSSEEDVDPTSLSSLCPPQAGHNSSMSSVEGYKEGGLSDSEQDLASGERSTDDDSMLNSEDTEWVSMNSNSEGARNDHYDSVRFPFGLEGTKDWGLTEDSSLWTTQLNHYTQGVAASRERWGEMMLMIVRN